MDQKGLKTVTEIRQMSNLITYLLVCIDHVTVLKQNRKIRVEFFPERIERLQSSGREDEGPDVAPDEALKREPRMEAPQVELSVRRDFTLRSKMFFYPSYSRSTLPVGFIRCSILRVAI